jgi:hypothetical protein
MIWGGVYRGNTGGKPPEDNDPDRDHFSFFVGTKAEYDARRSLD